MDCSFFRYLHHTFGLAYDAYKPDIVAFLGDIIDEGSKATDMEYEAYVWRIKKIFKMEKGTKV